LVQVAQVYLVEVLPQVLELELLKLEQAQVCLVV
jgi:hypothetical protein